MRRPWAVEPRGEYPAEWERGEIQQDVMARAGWRCEHCGMAFQEGTTLAKDATNAVGKPIILTVHHIDGNKSDCRWENLVALCQVCHLKMHHLWAPGMCLPLEWHNQIPEWIQARGLAWRVNPQLALFQEEWD